MQVWSNFTGSFVKVVKMEQRCCEGVGWYQNDATGVGVIMVVFLVPWRWYYEGEMSL